MADAVAKIRDHEFALEFNETTRTFFAKAGPLYPGAIGKAMTALAANPSDKAAEAIVNQDRSLHSMLRTTCVATLIQGGHALNALPQSVSVNVNCRMFPGRTANETQAELAQAIGNPAIRIEQRVKDKPIALPPPLNPAIIGPMEQLSAKYFPGVLVVPTISTGASDGVYTGGVGIPTYGVPGIWVDSKMNNIHGLDEHMEVRSLYEGRDYLYALVKLLSSK
jgi:acetylornithine deacetylase/succinyl-diaminopimelate desuccinylase-like protein